MNDDIDYRNLLAASSEEDLVLFQADLVTHGTKHDRETNVISSASTCSIKSAASNSASAFTLFVSWRSKIASRMFRTSGRNEKKLLERVLHGSQTEGADITAAFNANINESEQYVNSDLLENPEVGRVVNCTELSLSAPSASNLESKFTDYVLASHTVDSFDGNASHSDGTTAKNSDWCTGLPATSTAADRASQIVGFSSADDPQVEMEDSETAPLVGYEAVGAGKSDYVYIKDGKPYSISRRLLASMVLIVILAAAIGVGVALGIIYNKPSEEEPRVGYVYRDAAVAADAARCSEIGRDALMNGGGAIDAAIAGLLCVGLYNAHSAGIGGGSFILYYDRAEREATFLDAREKAPAAASRDMYQNASDDASTFGGLAIGVPGEIRGYGEAHQRFGKLPWADLFAPSITLAEEGFLVSEALANAISQYGNVILDDPSLREVLTDGNGNILKEGDTMYRPDLAVTLREIADGGADVFYTGQMAEDIASDVQARDGIITTQDLANYEVEMRTPISIEIEDMTAFTGRPPCSGAVFSLIMNILEGYNFDPESLQSVNDETLTYHRIIEAFKFAYAKRSALGDSSYTDVAELVANMTSQDFADGLRARINDDRTYNYTYYDPEFQIVNDGGTAHISIVDAEGNAAAVTSTVNTYFGSKVRSPKTGIIFNNEMDDFSKPGAPNSYGVPPSPSNYIVPGKRPLSSMTPVILVDGDGDVRFVVGASGGTRITTAVSLVTMENFWFGSHLADSIEKERVHHQLVPEYPSYEPGFSMDVVHGLEEKLHRPQESTSFSVVQAIKRLEDDSLEAHCDGRKGGRPAGY